MQGFQKILYATDFSDSSTPAAKYARYQAELSGASIHVLHVVKDLLDQRTHRIQPESLERLEKEVELHAIKDMTDFCDEPFDAAVNYTTQVMIGATDVPRKKNTSSASKDTMKKGAPNTDALLFAEILCYRYIVTLASPTFPAASKANALISCAPAPSLRVFQTKVRAAMPSLATLSTPSR